jgi:hypothetical protein
MDDVRQKNWISITAYLASALFILSLLFFWAETYFPSQSNDLIPLQGDRISRWLFKSPRWQNWQKADNDNTASLKELFLQLDRKQSAGKSELIYRGLEGRSEFRIDVIILELDPHVSYPYRFKISEAKKSFRLANRQYKLIYAKKGAIQLKQIN